MKKILFDRHKAFGYNENMLKILKKGVIKMQKLAERYETMSLAERRLAILVGLKAVDRERLDKVCAKMDEIRERITPKSKMFDGVAEIRKWREAR